MIIKKFLGKTETEAIEAARKDLGDGVVIMNVRDVKRKGLFGLFGGSQVEVTAALEDERDSFRQTKKESQVNAPLADAARSSAGQGTMVQNTADQNIIRQNNIMQNTVGENTMGQNTIGMASYNIERRLDNLQMLLEAQLGKAGAANSLDNEAAAGREDQRAGVQEKTAEDNEEEEISELDKFIRLLYNTMLENELDEKYVNQILEDADKNRKANVPFDYILANIYQKMVLKFGKSEGIVPAAEGTKAVFFIGPTGVGKTTTIAKVASKFVMEEKKRVALLTTDTYRIAAAEQLRTYANILEVPFRVIYTEEELVAAVEDFQDYDYIFVDTAGHSHQNEEQLENMKSLMDSVKDIVEKQCFLVLSATTKYRDLIRIAENYKTVADYELIFTKLDETTSLGSLLNVKMQTDVPIAYVTCGQNVPNDIEQFNPQKTVKQLLGGKHERTC